MTKSTKSKTDADGLRYVAKSSGGSPFVESAKGMTISCYKCSLHKPRSLGVFRLMFNQRLFLCGDCGAKNKDKQNSTS